MPVFRGYDQVQLDLQYDSAARDPALADLRARREAQRGRRSDEMRREFPSCLDLPYGDGARETLDLFLSNRQPAPLFVMIHGGYWRAGDKKQVHFLADAFVGEGIHFAAINYPLAPAASLTEIVAATRRALLFLYREAPKLGVDADRIHVGGHSAGGHLAALTVATDWAAFGGPKTLVRSATAVSGLYDLSPFPLLMRKPDLQFTETELSDLAPLHLRPCTDAPLILSVGTRESDEFLRNKTELASVWRDHTIMDVPVAGACHFDVLDALLCDSDLRRAVLGTIAGD